MWKNCPPKEIVEVGDTALRGSVKVPEGFSNNKPRLQNQGGVVPEVLQPRVFPRKIPRKPSHCPPAQCRHQRNCPEGTVIPLCPKDVQQLLRLPNS